MQHQTEKDFAIYLRDKGFLPDHYHANAIVKYSVYKKISHQKRQNSFSVALILNVVENSEFVSILYMIYFPIID